jgi:glycosyltransferase involved in cell wall biosynthesis
MTATHPEAVSLYIPCRNAESHLEGTLESVFSQSYPIAEVIAIDDGSTDQTAKILGSHPVQVIRHPKALGITQARNTALEQVRGDYVASVDADVILEPDWLEKIMGNFSEGLVGGVGGRIVEKNTQTLIGQWILAHRNPDKGKCKGNPPALPTAAVIYRRKALLEIGGFNDDKRYDHSDLDASMRVVMIGYRLIYEPEAICHHHFQGGVRALFDGVWRFKKDAYINCGLFTNGFGLRRKIKINLGEFYQMAMDDFHEGRHSILPLSIIGALRHSLMDIRLFCQLHPANGKLSDAHTFMALNLGLQYIFSQKETISRSLAAEILKDVVDICMDSEIQNSPPEFRENAGDQELLARIKDRFPLADLQRVSDWLVMILGFLNSFPAEIWENMNRLTEEKGRMSGEELGISTQR